MPKNEKAPSRSYKVRSSKQPYIRITKNSNKEYEDIQCPICMDPPHEAVLLICSSHDKGCVPFMCATCLRQYHATSEAGQMSCPLCRGQVTEEQVVERARKFMDSKKRSCQNETCRFKGDRREMTQHRRVHHRDTELAVEEEARRRREWERREREWQLRDIISYAVEATDETRTVRYATSADAMSAQTTSVDAMSAQTTPTDAVSAQTTSVDAMSAQTMPAGATSAGVFAIRPGRRVAMRTGGHLRGVVEDSHHVSVEEVHRRFVLEYYMQIYSIS